MIFIYGFIVGIPCLLIYFIIKKIVKAKRIQQHGIKTYGVVTHITVQYFSKGSAEKLALQYKDNTGTGYSASATVTRGRYKTGDRMSLVYLPAKPSQYVIDGTNQGNWIMLIFCILLLLFTVFAVYKINEMAASGI